MKRRISMYRQTLPALGWARPGRVGLLVGLCLVLIMGCNRRALPASPTPILSGTPGVTLPKRQVFAPPSAAFSFIYPPNWTYYDLEGGRWLFLPASNEDDTAAEPDQEVALPPLDPRITPYILVFLEPRPVRRPWDERELFYTLEELTLPVRSQLTPQAPRALYRSDMPRLWQLTVQYRIQNQIVRASVTVARLSPKTKLVFYGEALQEMWPEVERAYTQMVQSLHLEHP